MADSLDVLVLCSDPVNLRRTLNLAQELVHFEQVCRNLRVWNLVDAAIIALVWRLWLDVALELLDALSGKDD